MATCGNIIRIGAIAVAALGAGVRSCSLTRQPAAIQPLPLTGWDDTDTLFVRSRGNSVICIASAGSDEFDQVQKVSSLDPDRDNRWLNAIARFKGPVRLVYDVSLTDGRVTPSDWASWQALPSEPRWGVGRLTNYKTPLKGFEYEYDHRKDLYELSFQGRPVGTASRRPILVSGSPDKEMLAVLCALGEREGSANGELYFHGPFVIEFFRASDAHKIGEGQSLAGVERSMWFQAVWSPDSAAVVVHAGKQYSGVPHDLVWAVSVPAASDQLPKDAGPRPDSRKATETKAEDKK